MDRRKYETLSVEGLKPAQCDTTKLLPRDPEGVKSWKWSSGDNIQCILKKAPESASDSFALCDGINQVCFIGGSVAFPHGLTSIL